MAWTEINDDETESKECCDTGIEHLKKIECLLEKILEHMESCKPISASEDEEEIVIGYHERKQEV